MASQIIDTWSVSLPVGVITMYVGICVGYLLLQPFFVFLPSRKLNKIPSDFGLTYREHFFPSLDNVKLQAWLLSTQDSQAQAPKDRMVILFCSGMKGAMSKFLPGNQALVEAGFDVFMFSYRGFGKSGLRWPTERGVYKDTEAAYKYLHGELQYPEKQIIIFGQSIGCAPAARTASRFNPRALMLEGGFPSVPDVAARTVPWLPVQIITLARLDLKKLIVSVACPVLVFHSEEDEVIPLKDAHAIYGLIQAVKKLEVIKGKHALGLETQPQKFITTLREFV